MNQSELQKLVDSTLEGMEGFAEPQAAQSAEATGLMIGSSDLA